MRRILDSLASIQLTLILLVIVAIAIAAATFVESRIGTEGARGIIYNARWFEGVLVLLTVNLLLTLGRWFPFRAPRLGFFLVHVAMIVILVAAGMTRFLGQEGTMHIREGQQSDMMLSREDHVRITSGEASASFPVRLFRAGRQSVKKRLTVGDRTIVVSVEEYFPHYETPHDHAHPADDPNVLELTVDAGERTALSLRRGHPIRVGDVLLSYQESALLSSVGESPTGSLEVRVGDETEVIPVTPDDLATLRVGDVTFTITEFQADFKVGGQAEGAARMSNPMIRVEVRSAAGDRDERMLFAYYPEFAAQHGQAEGPLAPVETHYRFEPRVLFTGSGNSLHGCSSLPLVELNAEAAGGSRILPPGQLFPVTPLVVYRTRENDFGLVVRGGGGLTTTPAPSEGKDAPPAVRILASGEEGESATATLLRATGATELELGGEAIHAAFGPVPIELPYAIHLDDFVLLTYPGSDRPAGYESHVRLEDPERGIDGRPLVIRMNAPLTHRGRKHFQNSYDTDNRGTYLIVNQDPGKWPTYFGYTLITLGFLLSLLKDVIWRRPRVGPARVRSRA